MSELICHLLGDYCLQNQWMADNKPKSMFVASVHAFCYMLPFLVLSPSLGAYSVMLFTHMFIDRFRLASYWVSFYGIGEESSLSRYLWAPATINKSTAPEYLRVWLLIIVDNTFHLLINHLSLQYL
jgi:hypothetical protein